MLEKGERSRKSYHVKEDVKGTWTTIDYGEKAKEAERTVLSIEK